VRYPRPAGGFYSEEVFGTEGFVGPTSTLYHIHPPTQVCGWESLYSTRVQYVETDVLRMRHVQSWHMNVQGDPVTGRRVLFGNGDCEVAVCVPTDSMTYFYKNGQADELLFIHHGSGHLLTSFGLLEFVPGDYIVMPKGTLYSMRFDKADPHGPPNRFLCIEAVNGSHIQAPPRYLSKKTGQFLEHSPYCERDLRIPQLPLTYDEQGEFDVRIKAMNAVHRYVYPYHPLDVVGWDGCFYPYAFSIHDFEPIVGSLHMPPTIHQTFEAFNFVICSFCPRMLDFHPESIRVPYNHSNLDSDELMYYVDNSYKARRGIESGSITMHPQGLPHGPHPGTIEETLEATRTEELVVMCDTFRPMYPTQLAIDHDDDLYPKSWDGEHFPRLVSTV
jgi:homogentisate 1,2-dioxygenase